MWNVPVGIGERQLILSGSCSRDFPHSEHVERGLIKVFSKRQVNKV